MNEYRLPRLLAAVALAASVLAGACSKGEVPPPPQEPHDHGTTEAPPPPIRSDEGTLPEGHPPIGASSPGSLPPVTSEMGTGEKGLAWDAPSGWRSVPPANSMRKAQYQVPGPDGDGECIVFYFGPGQGGDPKANAVRWAQQFKRPDGSSAEGDLRTSEMKLGEMDILMVDVAGTYSGGMTGGMTPAEEKPGYALLGAVVEGPDANWFFKFTGPEKTVTANRAAFETMVKSVKRGA